MNKVKTDRIEELEANTARTPEEQTELDTLNADKAKEEQV